MVSINKIKTLGDGAKIIEAYGLSTDAKPADHIANGSSYVEMDTGKVYFYDQENETWREV